MTDIEIKNMIEQFAAIREQCTKSIEQLKVKLKCPSNYTTDIKRLKQEILREHHFCLKTFSWGRVNAND